jgi:hypothetical protein
MLPLFSLDMPFCKSLACRFVFLLAYYERERKLWFLHLFAEKLAEIRVYAQFTFKHWDDEN